MKRPFDIFLVLISAPVWVPVLCLVALVVRFKIGSPILFRQQRPGRNNVPFKLLKFRTMTEARNQHGHLLSDADRLTPVGHWLRVSSLDELPELFNVLAGSMSLVGPRPLLMDYLGRYTEAQARRHEVRPGITGWAQVNGRNAISWEKKFELDVWYVDHHNLWLDCKILALTLIKVFRREHISADGHATMPAFEGTSPQATAK